MRISRRRLVFTVAALVVCLGLAAVAISPTTIRRGLNYKVSTVEMPAYVKAIDFLHRHYEYQRLSQEITQGLTSDRDKVLAVFAWTRRNIRPTPDGWPIVDDHILNIIIRGYGVGDQMADVFATLSTYGGVPAFWTQIAAPGTDKRLFLTFANVNDQWTPLDVANGLMFRKTNGDFVSVEEVAATPSLVEAVAGQRLHGGLPYTAYLSPAALLPFQPPTTLRTDLQKPFPRVWYEFKRLVRLEN